MSDHANRRAIAHFIKSLFRRFWPGITAFWLISFGASLWMLIDIDSLPSSTALSWLELLAFVWITVRLAIAESRFRVHGDWRSRPVRRWVLPLSQVMLLIGVLVPALLLRAVCMWPSLPLNRDSWVDLMQTVWVPTLGIAGIVALIIAVVGRWRTMRTWMWITLFAFALIAGRLPLGWMKRVMLPDVPTRFQSGGYEQNSLAMSASRKLLPADALLLGGWPLPIAEDAEDYVFEFLRLPISTQSSGEVVERDNLRARIRWMQLDGERLQLGVETRFYNSNVVPNPDSLFFVVKYSDGSYGSRKEFERQVVPSALPLAPVHTVVHSGSYTSPMCLPENTASWEELLAGAELLVFAPIDADKLSRLAVPDRNASRQEREETSLTLTPNAPDDIFREQIHRLIDRGNHTHSDVVDQAKRAIKALDARAVPFVLDYHPWTKQCWDEVVGPYLESQASEEHLPQMLDALEFDPRIGEIMIARGWEEQAIPELKQHLIDGHLLPMPCMIALARLGDPALGPHFQREFPRYSDLSNSNLGVLGELVRAHPACDWSKSVAAGWKNRKYGLVSDGAGENYFALWAAEQGDTNALRRLAEYAAGENSISREWAQRMIAPLLVDRLPADADLVNWLRENIDRLKYSPPEGGYKTAQ